MKDWIPPLLFALISLVITILAVITQTGSDLLLSIIAGLLASGLTLIINSYWQKIGEPWSENMVYKGVKVEGNWECTVRYLDDKLPGKSSNYDVSLNQISHTVKGEMVNRDERHISYTLVGELRDMILTLTYSMTDLTTIDRGCFTFLLVKNGQALEGYGAFYYAPDHYITKAEVILTRVN